MNSYKGLEIVWLSKTDLTNLNSGEGGTNYIDVKKYRHKNVLYPYVSGQAMRHYLRDAMRRILTNEDIMCVPDENGENCGNAEECINCDLFGFMKPKKKQGSQVRVSPVKMSPAMGLLPFDHNSTLDFLTRSKGNDLEKTGGDIVNVELGVNIYKCGISIDLVRIYAEEQYDENGMKIKMFEKSDKEKKKRIELLLDAILNMTDYSKQARLLSDFTPDVMIAALQKKFNHRLQKALHVDSEMNLNIPRLRDILTEMKENDNIYVSILPDVINNEDAVKSELENLNIDIVSRIDLINKLKEKFNGIDKK